MNWLIISAILAISNVAIMSNFARGSFGPTPVVLPLAIAVIAVSLSLLFGTAAFICYKKQSNWHQYFIAAGIWIGLIAYNMWIFNEIMYVT